MRENLTSESELRGRVAVSVDQGESKQCCQSGCCARASSSCRCTVADTDSAVRDGDFSVRSEGVGIRRHSRVLSGSDDLRVQSRG